MSDVIREDTKSGPQASGAPAPSLSPLPFDTARYRHDSKAVARIIQGDRRLRQSTPKGPIFHGANREPRAGSPGESILI